MRRLLILFALPLVGAAQPDVKSPPVPHPPTTDKADCRLLTETGVRGRATLRKLGELPPADAWTAMWRTDEKGCPDPVLYRDR